MSVEEAELGNARAAMKLAQVKLEELEHAFLSNTTKLGDAAAIFGVDPRLDKGEFAVACQERLAEIRQLSQPFLKSG